MYIITSFIFPNPLSQFWIAMAGYGKSWQKSFGKLRFVAFHITKPTVTKL